MPLVRFFGCDETPCTSTPPAYQGKVIAGQFVFPHFPTIDGQDCYYRDGYVGAGAGQLVPGCVPASGYALHTKLQFRYPGTGDPTCHLDASLSLDEVAAAYEALTGCEYHYNETWSSYEGGDSTGLVDTLASYVKSFAFADQLLGQYRLCELTPGGDLNSFVGYGGGLGLFHGYKFFTYGLIGSPIRYPVAVIGMQRIYAELAERARVYLADPEDPDTPCGEDLWPPGEYPAGTVIEPDFPNDWRRFELIIKTPPRFNECPS